MSDIVSIDVEIKGTAPMLQHNGMLSDPQNPFAKACKVFSSKKNKTDEDFIEMHRLEFQGSSYWSQATGWTLPSDMIEATLEGGARKRKKGKAFRSTVFLEDDVPFKFADDDKTPAQLYEIDKYRDVRRVVVPATGNSVQRCRPRIDGWSCKFNIKLITGAAVDIDSVKEALETSAAQIGIGDFRPKFGRFEITKFEVVD